LRDQHKRQWELDSAAVTFLLIITLPGANQLLAQPNDQKFRTQSQSAAQTNVGVSALRGNHCRSKSAKPTGRNGPGGSPACSQSGTGQLPDTFGHGASQIVGVVSDSNPNGSDVAADNFRSLTGGFVTQVDWWGFYVDFGSPTACSPVDGDSLDSFTITYLTDLNGIPGPVLAGPFSVSLSLKQPTGRLIDTTVGFFEEFAFSASHSPVSINPNECVWLQIENNTSGICTWLWETAPPGDGYSWQQSSTNDFDLSWCVDVSVEPLGCSEPCDILCEPNAIPESEPDCGFPNDTSNGGCNSIPPAFGAIDCGDIVCGTAAFDGLTRDTDWYSLTLQEPTEITIQVTAEFNFVAGIIDNDGIDDCGQLGGFLDLAVAQSCSPTEVTTCVPAGNWWIFVAPQFAAQVQCGAEYQLNITCNNCAPGLGACCVQDTCVITDSNQCMGMGGVYSGDSTLCAAIPCPPPPEACCFPNGSCQDLAPATCFTSGGIPKGPGTVCTSVLCDVFGACCPQNDSCVEVAFSECAQSGGVWQGTASTCINVDCAVIPPGNDDCGTAIFVTIPATQSATTAGANTDITPDCQATNSAPGVWYYLFGDGSTLTASLCSGTTYNSRIGVFAGECGALTCIIGDNDFCSPYSQVTWCSEIATVYYLLVHGDSGAAGDFQLSISSDSAACTNDPSGACCLNTAECIDGSTLNDCFTVDGTYQGDGTVCGDTGACCIATTCVVATVDCCIANGGEFSGEGTDCTPNPCVMGACCGIDATCTISDSIACEAVSGTYLGDGTLCGQDACQTGACCLSEGSCLVETESSCSAAGGSYQGDLVGCEAVDCIFGACCLVSSGCITNSELHCVNAGGFYQGDFTTCLPDPCIIGACCQPNGNCIDTSASNCSLVSGEYQGDAMACESVTCLKGACCLPTNECIVISESACSQTGGAYLGNEVGCSAITCVPSGACCLPNSVCDERTPLDCDTDSGLYQGDNTSCFEIACPEPVGACCLPDLTCQELSEVTCLSQNGEYQGDASICQAVSCPTPCAIAGNMNSDCMVNGLDIHEFVSCYLIGGPAVGCECGDYDRSGFVDEPDISDFVVDLLLAPSGIIVAENPKGTISVTEIPSPEPCESDPPVTMKLHKITATWTSILCGINEVRIDNLTTGQTLAEESYPLCPPFAVIEVDAELNPALDVIQTTVLTCGPNPGHVCCEAAVLDDVTSCAIHEATYIHIADETGELKEMRTLTCPGAPDDSTWSRKQKGEGDLLPIGAAGATYPMTAEHESKPADDLEIKRSHNDGDGDCSFSNAKMTVVALDMKIHKPKVIDPAGPEVADAVELTVGAQTFVNLDNDDKDGLFDTKSLSEDTDVPGEDEMCKLRLRLKPFDIPDPCGNVQIEAFEGEDDIKVWRNSAKIEEYVLGSDIPVHGNFRRVGDWLELDLWVEGRSPSTSQQQVKLRMTYDQAPDTINDEVALTIIGIESIQWLGRNNSNSDNNVLDSDPNWPSGLAPGALRVFPGARLVGVTPETSARDILDVSVTLTVDPIESVHLYFDSFDVDDPTSALGPLDGSSAGNDENEERDNRGNSPSRDGQFVKADGTNDEIGGIKQQAFTTSEATFGFRVTLQPGDNFRVVGNGDRDFLLDLRNRDQDYADNNADKQRIVHRNVAGNASEKEIRDADNYVSNKVLTVWRDLHVEVDSMTNVAGNTVSGNIINIAGGDSATAQSIQVNVALNDMSPNLTSNPARNGRSENGTLSVAGTTTIQDLTGNSNFLIARAAGLNICSTPLPFAATGNGGVVMNGTVTRIDNGSVRLTINPAFPPGDWGAFVGGTITIGGGNNMNIVAVDPTNSRITVAALSIPFSLVDDDAYADGDALPPLDTSGMAVIWSDAFIRVLFDTGQNTTNAPFRLNTVFAQTASAHVNESRGHPNAVPRYWVVLVKQGFQTDPEEDSDANTEETWRAVGGRFGIGRGGAMMLEESVRDWITKPAQLDGAGGIDPDNTGAPWRQSRRQEILNHEVGHAFSLLHQDGVRTGTEPFGGVMRPSCCPANIRQASTFTRRSLNIIRNQAFPGM